MGEWEIMLDDNDVRKLFSRLIDRDEVEFYLDNIVDTSIEPYPENQPHVTLRPRPNFIQGKILKPKHKYVTLQRVKAHINIKTESVKHNAKKKLVVDEKMGSQDALDAGDANSYDKVREMTIAVNKERLNSLKLHKLTVPRRSHKDPVESADDTKGN